MKRERYDEYIRRFNAEDHTAFDEFLTVDTKVQNGELRYTGIQGMKDHYAKIWKNMKETLKVMQYVTDERCVGVHLNTHFEVLKDDPKSVFGSVRKGEQFDYDGLIMYTVENGKFTSITVSYLSFVRTDLNGVKHSLGIVH